MGAFNLLLGKKSLQPFFQKLHSAALKGLNFGRASDYAHNGEAFVLDAVMKLLAVSAPVVFDVGANKGEFVKRVLQHANKNIQLYAFEPSQETFKLLKSSVPLSANVHLINAGFSDTPGHTDLFYDKKGSGLASVYQRDLHHANIQFSEKETIELTTLDIFCEQHGLSAIHFLKLDVEGHELAVLKGGKKMFENKRVSIIQFEFGGCNIDSRTFFKDYYQFFSSGFDLYRIVSDGLWPLKAYSEKLEVFQSANYLAVRKDLGPF